MLTCTSSKLVKREPRDEGGVFLKSCILVCGLKIETKTANQSQGYKNSIQSADDAS